MQSPAQEGIQKAKVAVIQTQNSTSSILACFLPIMCLRRHMER
jgi:hypothetical protein